MNKRLVTIALGALSVPAFGLGAYGAALAVSAGPASQVVIPASFHSSNGSTDELAKEEANEAPGADANEEANEAPGADANEVPGADDAANHDANDTSTTVKAPIPATPTTVRHSDDGPGHDVGDDHGGTPTTSPTLVVSATSGHDSSGSSGSGSSGSRSSGSGSSGDGSRGSGSSGSGSSGSSGHGSGGSDDGSGHH
jgi:hypothetical protein